MILGKHAPTVISNMFVDTLLYFIVCSIFFTIQLCHTSQKIPIDLLLHYGRTLGTKLKVRRENIAILQVRQISLGVKLF